MKKKSAYLKGTEHKVFPNLLNRKFTVQAPNSVWCTDFTYMNLSNGSKRYNCTILDIYDRSVIATLNGKEITSNLAIRTLKLAFKNL
ncbi:DDE-type integrase/transposase/recombinase [Lutibacter sp. B2]|nr:DDE-type integrase/transposase/recombinase [Lutibacter sp. B2]